MNFLIKVTAGAREDTLNAFNYYQNIRVGLGEEFLKELEIKYIEISANPFANSYIDNRCIIRDVVIKRFPFLVIYKIESNYAIILSVHNTNKKPIIFE